MNTKIKLFVCDDEKSKHESLESLFIDEGYEFVWIPRTEELVARIKSGETPDGVFLDLIYESNEDEKTEVLNKSDILSLRRLLGRRVPLFIYTQHTDSQKELLRDVVFEGLADWWITVEEVDKKPNPDIKLRIINEIEGYDELRDGLWMTHLSDLHFGRQFPHVDRPAGEALPGLIGDKLVQCPPKAQEYGHAPALTVISGDLTQAATRNEFAQAKGFIEKFEDQLRNSKIRKPVTIVAPGNHEVPWDFSIIAETTIKTGKVTQKRSEDEERHGPKWMRFNSTFSDYLSGAEVRQENGQFWAYDLSSRFGCIVYVVNTAFAMTFKNNTPQFKSEWIDELEEMSTDKPGILVTHHPVRSWFSEEDRDTKLRPLLDILSTKLNIKIVLSGHKHRAEIETFNTSNQKKIFEVQTGSLSSSEEEQPLWEHPQFRLLNVTLDVNGNWKSLRSWIAKYETSKYIYAPQGEETTFFHEHFWN